MSLLKFETNFTVFPTDTNFHEPPCIFGGCMLAKMDICAAMATRQVLRGLNTGADDAVTVNVHTSFARPAYVGDIVYLTGYVEEVGSKSVTTRVIAIREDKDGKKERMAEGMFVFVARKAGVPHVHGITDDDIRTLEP